MNTTDRANHFLTHQDATIKEIKEIVQGLLDEIPTAYQEGYLAGCKFTDAELSIERHMP